MTDPTVAEMEAHTPLPGEERALEMRHGGHPITDEEALGVARRLARMQTSRNRPLSAMGQTNELPAYDAPKVQAAHRFAPRTLFRARARAEMEGIALSDVLNEALELFASAPPGSRLTVQSPRRKS